MSTPPSFEPPSSFGHEQQIDPGAVVSRTFEVYLQQFGVLFSLALGVFAIEAVLALIMPALGAVSALVLGPLFLGMVVQVARDAQDGTRESSVGDLLSSVAPIILPLLGLAILSGLAIAVGLVLFLVPGLFLATIWAVITPVLVLERPGVFASFSRSQALVKGHGWQVFAVILLGLLIGLVVGVIEAIVTGAAGRGAGLIVQWLVSAAVEPFAVLLSAVLYFRLRDVNGEPPLPSGPAGDPNAVAGL